MRVINPSLSDKLAVTFSKENARQDNTDVPQGPPIVSSRPITRLKARQAPRGEVESVVHEEMRYTTEELNEFANSSKQKSGEHVWEWILRVWDNGRRNVKLGRLSVLTWALRVKSLGLIWILGLIWKLAQFKKKVSGICLNGWL